MISIYQIKPQFQRLLIPVLEGLHRCHVTANQITISACVLSLGIGVAFWFADCYRALFLALPVGLLVRMALNALDGMMARQYHQISAKGEVLNELGDVISDLFVLLPLLKFHPGSLFPIVAFISLSIVNEYAGVMGKVISGQRRYEGPIGKSDRAFLMGVYGLLGFFGVSMASCATPIFIVLDILLCLGTFNRVRQALIKLSSTQIDDGK